MNQKCLLLWSAAAIVCNDTFGGDFVNLTFDEPNLSGSLTPLLPAGPFIGSAAELLKGWSPSANGVPFATMAYTPYRQPSFGSMIVLTEEEFHGYSLSLYSVGLPNGPEIRISQRGTIPADAVGLRVYNTATVRGYVNGEFIGSITDRANLTWDVRAFAGQDVELSIVLPANRSGSFDIFGFEMIPEPSTTALLVVGGLGLGWVLVSRARAGAGSGVIGMGRGRDGTD